MLTDQELAEMRARCDAAMKGPRTFEDFPCSLGNIVFNYDEYGRCEDDLIFFYHASTDLPACLDEIDRLKAEVKRLSYLDRPSPPSSSSV